MGLGRVRTQEIWKVMFPCLVNIAYYLGNIFNFLILLLHYHNSPVLFFLEALLLESPRFHHSLVG